MPTVTSIRCGHCKGSHDSVSAVKACSGGTVPTSPQASTQSAATASQPVPGAAPATAKQVAFVTKLAGERQAPPANEAGSTFPHVERLEDLLGGHKFVSKAEASKVIEWLLALPKAATAPTATEANPYLAIAKKGDVHIVDGTYYRIHVGQNSGRAYACEAVVTTPAVWGDDGKLVKPGVVRWDRAKGMIFKLTEATFATAAQAHAFAMLAGRCCFCSHAIDTPESTTVGYGPVCAAKYGLPWGDTVQAVG